MPGTISGLTKWFAFNNVIFKFLVVKDIDYLIVGQGLAGSVLALALLAQHQRVCVINDPATQAASAVAGGLYNPITGRRMSKTWQATQLFPFLEKYYQQHEQKLGSRFFYPKTIYRPFASVEEQNTWIAETARPDIAFFAHISSDETSLNTYINAPHGGMLIDHAGYVEVKAFLDATRQYLENAGLYYAEKFDYQQLTTQPGQVTYGFFRARKIVFCEGPHAVHNPFFNWLPFRPVKGEILHISMDDFPTEYIVNQHLFVIPLPDGTYRAGATYDWRNLDWATTDSGRNELLEKISRLIRKPVQVLNQWAGIRPATADRRPLAGIHPEYEEIAFFGGMGSKGVSLAPYLAQHFTDFLLLNKEIMPEININRYISLYKK